MYITSEPISITNAAGITFLTVCCASIAFMGWFFISLTRERRPRHVQCRLEVRVKSTDGKTSQVEKIHIERPAARVRALIDVRTATARQTPRGMVLGAPIWRRWG